MRKRLVIGLLSGALVGVMLPGVVAAEGNPANIVNPSDKGEETICSIYEDQHGIAGLGDLETEHATYTEAVGENQVIITYVCQGMLPAGTDVPPGYKNSGFVCVDASLPTVTSFRATPSGRYTLTCRWKSPI